MDEGRWRARAIVGLAVAAVVVLAVARFAERDGGGDRAEAGDALTTTTGPSGTSTSRDQGECHEVGCNPDLTAPPASIAVPGPTPSTIPAPPLGTPATFNMYGGQTMQVTVTKVEPATCDAPDAIPSQDGTFLAVSVRLDTGPGPDMGVIASTAWSIVGNYNAAGVLDIIPAAGAARNCTAAALNYSTGPSSCRPSRVARRKGCSSSTAGHPPAASSRATWATARTAATRARRPGSSEGPSGRGGPGAPAAADVRSDQGL